MSWLCDQILKTIGLFFILPAIVILYLMLPPLFDAPTFPLGKVLMFVIPTSLFLLGYSIQRWIITPRIERKIDEKRYAEYWEKKSRL